MNINFYKNLIFFLSVLIGNTLLLSYQENLIESVCITKKRADIYINKDFKAQYLKSDFFVEYEDDEIDLTKLDYSIITMPLFMNLITLIWASGKEYYIDSMDYNLYFSLKKIKKIFKRFYPATRWKGRLTPRKLVDNAKKLVAEKKDSSYIALLFSHGLDSLTTSFRHSDKNQLLITAWGHFDSPLDKESLWYQFKDMILDFGKKFNYKNTFFKSNYHNFINFSYVDRKITPEITNWRIEAIEDLGWTGLVAPILISKGYTKFYIASTYWWDVLYPQAAHFIVDHCIKFAGIDVVHDAFEITRAEKNEYIEKECQKRKIDNLFIRVCPNTSKGYLKNCCSCEKCLRTIAGFLIFKKNFQKFGFEITQEESIKRIKFFFNQLKTKSKLDDRTGCYWKNFQRIALKKLSQNYDEINEFLKWLISEKMDELIKPRPVKFINWDDFVDLCDLIPKKFLK